MLTGYAAVAELETQGVLAPGQEGWWKVWGATPADIRPRDIVVSLVDGEAQTVYVADVFRSNAYPLRYGLIDVDAMRSTIGALVPIVLFRRGTRNTLA